jgi:hypothetical protein
MLLRPGNGQKLGDALDPGRKNSERALTEGNHVPPAPAVSESSCHCLPGYWGWKRRPFYVFFTPRRLTRPTPRGDLGCQHALRRSIHSRCMRSAPAIPFPGARTTDRRPIVKQTSVRMPRGVPSFRTWGTVAMSVWLLAIWCRQRTTRNLRAKRVALGQRAPRTRPIGAYALLLTSPGLLLPSRPRTG